MKNELTCDVVEDLLPSYVENLTNTVTNEAILAHVEQCENCREKLERAKTTDLQGQDTENREIDYLKKTKKGYQKKVMLGVILTGILFLIAIFIRISLVSTPVENASLLDFDMNISEEERFINFYGNFIDSSKGIAKISYKMEDGVLYISVRQTMTPIFYKNARAKHISYKGKLKQIRVLDRIVWDHGEWILPEVAKIYATKHLYIGSKEDMEASFGVLGLSEKLGDCTIELHTSGEPYGMTLYLKEKYSKENADRMKLWMERYASATIALTDNMNYMEFVYDIDGKQEKFTFTEQQADSMVGQSVKKMTENAASFQKLMGILEFVPGAALYD